MTSRLRPSPRQERAILRTVVYSALFDYPLTLSQLRETLIGETADEATILAWFNNSAYLQHSVEYVDGFFFPRGCHNLLLTRERREHTSRQLLETLRPALHTIQRLPFVRMVALSGSLAHLNADGDADLDLFVITQPHRVWTTTVTALALARLFGWRKRLCLNYVISEKALWIAPADLFSANQIVHLQPLTGADAYARFLRANHFVRRFYPNFASREVPPGKPHRRWLEMVLNYSVAPVLEPLCRWLYTLHLRRRAHTWTSHDQVRLERECLKLHTQSHRREVMERFEQALDAAVAAAEVERRLYADNRSRRRLARDPGERLGV